MNREPTIAVGLVENAEAVAFKLLQAFAAQDGRRFGPGEYRVVCSGGTLTCSGKRPALAGPTGVSSRPEVRVRP